LALNLIHGFSRSAASWTVSLPSPPEVIDVATSSLATIGELGSA